MHRYSVVLLPHSANAPEQNLILKFVYLQLFTSFLAEKGSIFNKQHFSCHLSHSVNYSEMYIHIHYTSTKLEHPHNIKTVLKYMSKRL
jgi:hypothetical protein